MKNKMTLLEDLRREKEMVRQDCKESEKRLAEHWTYLSDNAGTLILQGTANAVLKTFGFGISTPKQQEQKESSTINNLLGGLTAYYPIIWKIVQPILWRYLIKKIKSLFSGEKKRGKD